MRSKSCLFSLFLSVAIATFSFVCASAAYGQESNHITREYMRLFQSYEVDDILTNEDSEFVRNYLIKDKLLNPLHDTVIGSFRTTGNVNESDSQFGTSVTLTGTVWHTGTFNYNFGGRLNGYVTAGPVPKNMTITVYCMAWGLEGSQLGLAYKDQVSHTVYNSKSIYMNKSKNYTGISAVHSINTSLDVTTASGAGFTVNAK